MGSLEDKKEEVILHTSWRFLRLDVFTFVFAFVGLKPFRHIRTIAGLWDVG